MRFTILNLLKVLSVFVLILSCSKNHELTIHNYRPEFDSSLKYAIEGFTTKYPKTTIKIDEVRNDAQAILKAKLDNNDASDILLLPSGDLLRNIIDDNKAYSLNKSKFSNRIPDGFRYSVEKEAFIYGLPLTVNVFGVFYNHSVFDAISAGVPSSSSGLAHLISVLKKNEYTPFASAFKEKWVSGLFFSNYYTYIHRSIGLKENLLSFNTSAMRDFGGYFDNVMINSNTKTEDMTFAKQIQQMNLGKTAMFIQTLQGYNSLKNVNPAAKIGFFPFPFSNNDNENQIFCTVDTVIVINNNSSKSKKKHAELFLEYLSSADCMKQFNQNSKVMPALIFDKISYKDPLYNDIYKYLETGKIYRWSQKDWSVDLYEQIKTGLSEYISGKKDMSLLLSEIDAFNLINEKKPF